MHGQAQAREPIVAVTLSLPPRARGAFIFGPHPNQRRKRPKVNGTCSTFTRYSTMSPTIQFPNPGRIIVYRREVFLLDSHKLFTKSIVLYQTTRVDTRGDSVARRATAMVALRVTRHAPQWLALIIALTTAPRRSSPCGNR